MFNISRAKCQQGISLIEVLVSVVVLSIGLLGIAGMQATGMKNNHAAYSKMQATTLAMDMADRIRANKDAASSYVFNSATSTPSAPTCLATGCSPSDLANADLYQWKQPLSSLLPDGKAIIEQNSTEMTITLFWRELNFNNDDLLKNCVSGQAADIACFQLSFTL